MAKNQSSAGCIALLNHLKKYGGGTVAEISFSSGLKKSTVYSWVTELHGHGRLKRTERELKNSKCVEHVFVLPEDSDIDVEPVREQTYGGIVQMGLAARPALMLAWLPSAADRESRT